jgi:hypothetical protein
MDTKTASRASTHGHASVTYDVLSHTAHTTTVVPAPTR